MFKVNRKIEYALIALKHMSHKRRGEITSAKEICDTYRTPFDPASRVLQIMAQHGILQAEQGAKGGYQIVRDISQISMKELSDIIIGPIEIVNCFHKDYSGCEIKETCHIISPMLNLNEKINKLFGEITVTDLIESRHQGEKNVRRKNPKEHKHTMTVKA
jgi:Rrf2 family protein